MHRVNVAVLKDFSSKTKCVFLVKWTAAWDVLVLPCVQVVMQLKIGNKILITSNVNVLRSSWRWPTYVKAVAKDATPAMQQKYALSAQQMKTGKMMAKAVANAWKPFTRITFNVWHAWLAVLTVIQEHNATHVIQSSILLKIQLTNAVVRRVTTWRHQFVSFAQWPSLDVTHANMMDLVVLVARVLSKREETKCVAVTMGSMQTILRTPVWIAHRSARSVNRRISAQIVLMATKLTMGSVWEMDWTPWWLWWSWLEL